MSDERELTEAEVWALTEAAYQAILDREQREAEAWARARTKVRIRPTAEGTPPTATRTNSA